MTTGTSTCWDLGVHLFVFPGIRWWLINDTMTETLNLNSLYVYPNLSWSLPEYHPSQSTQTLSNVFPNKIPSTWNKRNLNKYFYFLTLLRSIKRAFEQGVCKIRYLLQYVSQHFFLQFFTLSRIYNIDFFYITL